MIFHLIGIGGAGMSVIADMFLMQGYTITGSDRNNSENVKRLRNAGAKITIGHYADSVPAMATVVVSSAIKKDNPELLIALKRGQKIIHRSQALALLAQKQDFIAVAGAHGKTTTSGMLAVAFSELGLNPSYAIGASITGLGFGGHVGSGDIFVAEADESDGSFLNYSPRIALVTNVEPDHLDHYGSVENFMQAFVDFSQRICPSGLLVCCADDAGAYELAVQAHELGVRVCTYGFNAGDITGVQHIQILEMPVENSDVVQSAQLQISGIAEPIIMNLAVAGQHMLLNAVGAYAVGLEMGIAPTDMVQALYKFVGTRRRFEEMGTQSGVMVIDDYAHHPTEITATLNMARTVCTGRVLVLFQPHLYSRTKNFAQRFAQALELADEVIITSVYAARETLDAGVEGDEIIKYADRFSYLPDMQEAARKIAQMARANDYIITMGAGDITTMGQVILQELGVDNETTA